MYKLSTHNSGSARVFGYIRVFGISLSLNFRYKVYLRRILGIFGWILGIFGYFGEFFSGILVYHYPPWPTLIKLTRKILSREKFSLFVKTNIHFSHSTSQKFCYWTALGALSFWQSLLTSWHSSFNFSRVVGIPNLVIFHFNLFVSLSLIIKNPIGEKRI